MSHPVSTFTLHIFTYIYIIKCRNFDLPSSCSVHNRSKNSLVRKKVFDSGKIQSIFFISKQTRNLYHNISIYGKFKKKTFFSPGGHAQLGENLGTAVFFL